MLIELRKNSGFTLVEVMVATGIFLFAVSITFSVMLTSLRMDRNTQSEAILHQQGAKILNRIVMGEQGKFGLLKASLSSISISPDQTGISFSADTNSTFTVSTADDVAMSFSYSDADGDPATYEDNTVVFDPDTAVAGNELTVGTNVAGIQFSQAGGVITVVLRLAETVNGQTEFLRLSRDIWVRNA